RVFSRLAECGSTTGQRSWPGAEGVQVGAVSDQTRAQQYQQRLSQQFSVPGRVMQNGAVWRIQLGPFADKAQASAVQQRLQSEAQLQSFITRAN
ncbi:SPOR domain-containing protein, partial [Klebsiella pneumoniae]|uniref:SPOR domain-containing protein n=1 Tax=Klebsiella pneumoniae TaxID=573 RepID=UPI0022402BB5